MVIIDVLILVSKHIRTSEIKKLYYIIKEMNKNKFKIHINSTIISKYKIKDKCLKYEEDELISLSKRVDCILVVGLIANDRLTKSIEEIMSWNTIFIIPTQFGFYSDASKLINDGAYCLCTIYDFNRCLC
ncbi:MAG: hypothetical protein RR577_04510 [Erysipelotrichales bacterium]